MAQNRLLETFLVLACFFSCTPKRTSLPKVALDQSPKDDFKANEYVVVAYAPIERIENTNTAYQFAVFLDEKQVGLITVERHPDLPIASADTFYFLEEEKCFRPDTLYYLARFWNDFVYQVYEGQPSYQKVKSDIISILSGKELEPYAPFNNEEMKKLLHFIFFL